MSESEYERESDYESEYESESEDDTVYSEIRKFNYFNNCDMCIPVKNEQINILDKCDVLHIFKDKIADYYCCDKCCKLRQLFDDYICPFTKVCQYPEYDEVHKIMRDDVQKKDYTLELHSEMKTMYENLDKFDFYKWHREKKDYYKNTLCGYMNYYQRVHHIFIKITHYLQYYVKRDNNLHYEYLEETTEFLNQMIVQNSV